MATRNSKRTITVSVEQLENLCNELCNIGSLVGLGLRYVNASDQLDYDEVLAIRTLLTESRKRIAAHIAPLDDLLFRASAPRQSLTSCIVLAS